jgi:WD40 repeat protein
MTSEEALAVIEAVLNHDRLNTPHLNKLQKTVFRHAWEEHSYLEIARLSGYELGYVKQTGSQLWQLLSDALNEKVTKTNVQGVLKRKWIEGQRQAHFPSMASAAAPTLPSHSVDIASPKVKANWGNAADVSTFYGRAIELATLETWIVQDRCRLVGIFGMGGIGKTSLSIKLAKQIQEDFECVIWRSLRNAPPLPDLLTDLIGFVCHQQETDLSEPIDQKISKLLNCLRSRRCLLILDNGETVLNQGNCHGEYLPGYEGYAQLWQAIGETEHQSTLVLTSREKPRGIASSEGKVLPVRSLRLAGLSPSVGQAIFNLKGDFKASELEWQTLINHYAGNPLALKMVAPVIQELFAGQVADFLDCLQEGTLMFSDIQDLLAQQIDRLSMLEQHILYWLAISRKPITLSQLRANFTPPVALSQLLDALTSLEHRCLIDKTNPTLIGKAQTHFTLQPVVMEYMSDRLIQQVCAEIGILGQPDSLRVEQLLFHSHALIQAQEKDYIRETQVRLILQPIADRLLNTSTLNQLEIHLQQVLNTLRQQFPQAGYAGGNLLNLLCQLGINLTGWDFSGLAVWNAYLRGVSLHRVNFTGSDLARSMFTETFSQILSVAFNPDGTQLATGDVNHEIHVWHVSDGKELFSCKVEEGWVWSVTFSPNGRLLASSANRIVNVWDTQTGECLHKFRNYTDRVFSVAFSPDGRLLATGSEDHLIRIWEIRTGKLLHTLSGHTDEVRSVAFCPVERRAKKSKMPKAGLSNWQLASASFDGTIRLWDALTGEALHVFEGHSAWVWSVAFSPDGQTLASSGSDCTMRLWNVATGASLRVLTGHTQPVRAVAFAGDGRTVISGSDDRTLRLWDYHSGNCLRVLHGHTSWISSVAVNPHRHLFASGSEDQSVRLWDSRSLLCVKTLQGYSDGVWSVAFNPQGTVLASGSQDRVVRLWDRQTGTLLGSLPGHSSWVWSVVFHPTQPILASSSEDGTIKFWHTKFEGINTHQEIQTLQGHQDAVLSILFHPNGERIFSGSLDSTLKCWNVQTGECETTWQGHTGGIWCLDLSKNGKYLVSGSQDQTIKLWNTQTGECVKTFLGHEGWIRSVILSPNQKTIASGCADGMIKVWDIEQGVCLKTIQAHLGPVLSLHFHPAGETFASCGTDGKIKFWNALSHQCVRTLQAHDRWVRFLCYSPDGNTLASCSQDETIKLWQVSSPSHFVNLNLSEQPLQTIRIPRPYEEMQISQVKNLTLAQRSMLKMLGAVEHRSLDLAEHQT